MRHLTTLFDITASELEHIFAVTEDLKTKYQRGLRESILPGRVMALLFEKPSLRTRVSFEAGMSQLGGGSMMLGDDVGFGRRESVEDFCQVLSEYVDVIVARTFSHKTVEDLAEHCTCSVINGLTDMAHPCQAIADLYTLRERLGDLRGATLTWVGDGNNVARSLAIACALAGVKFIAAGPEGYQIEDRFLTILKNKLPEADVTITSDPHASVRDAAAVYTDVWTSMGQEVETERRRRAFVDFQVNAELMSNAPSDAYFMHCLPAHRGDEVTGDVIDGPQSISIPQAGNRMHAQKGILAWLLGPQS